jgi:hypothetical protein
MTASKNCPFCTLSLTLSWFLILELGTSKCSWRTPLVGYALRRWYVDCSLTYKLDPKQHHLWHSNPETLYGVESAALAPRFEVKGGSVE